MAQQDDDGVVTRLRLSAKITRRLDEVIRKQARDRAPVSRSAMVEHLLDQALPKLKGEKP